MNDAYAHAMQVQNASLTPRQGVTIFGSTNQDFCEEFEKMMASEFEMSMMESLPTSLVFKSNK